MSCWASPVSPMACRTARTVLPKGGVTDELVGPDLHTQLVLGDDTIMMLDEVHQDFKGFGSEFDGCPARERTWSWVSSLHSPKV